ncbi:MAG: DUF4446 family protein [Euzebyaceae bacterium]|nr:DUF4446 family protein [Euzebyaceae bacterium]
MELTAATTGVLLVLAIVLGIAAIGMAGTALAGQRRVRAAYRQFSMGSRDDVLTLLQRHIDEVKRLQEEVLRQRGYADELRELIRRGVSRVGTVRYDAFDDMGGRLSFSVALLDERGDGTILTAINGRTETRTYAKPVAAGDSRHNLSEEEASAIRQAMSLAGRTPLERVKPGRMPARPSA